jgi:hypothetical protein
MGGQSSATPARGLSSIKPKYANGATGHVTQIAAAAG